MFTKRLGTSLNYPPALLAPGHFTTSSDKDHSGQHLLSCPPGVHAVGLLRSWRRSDHPRCRRLMPSGRGKWCKCRNSRSSGAPLVKGSAGVWAGGLLCPPAPPEASMTSSVTHRLLTLSQCCLYWLNSGKLSIFRSLILFVNFCQSLTLPGILTQFNWFVYCVMPPYRQNTNSRRANATLCLPSSSLLFPYTYHNV